MKLPYIVSCAEPPAEYPHDTAIMTIQDAEKWVLEMSHWPCGCICPVSKKFCKREVTALRKGMVFILAIMHGLHMRLKQPWLHMETELRKRNLSRQSFTTMKYWGLIVQKTIEDCETEKCKYSGYWQLTDKGVEFLNGEISVPWACLTYNDDAESFFEDEVFAEDITEKEFDIRSVRTNYGLGVVG